MWYHYATIDCLYCSEIRVLDPFVLFFSITIMWIPCFARSYDATVTSDLYKHTTVCHNWARMVKMMVVSIRIWLSSGITYGNNRHDVTCHHASAYDDIMNWERFPYCWPFVKGIHLSHMHSPNKAKHIAFFIVFFSLKYQCIHDFIQTKDNYKLCWPLDQRELPWIRENYFYLCIYQGAFQHKYAVLSKQIFLFWR